MADDILKGIQTGMQFAKTASSIRLQREQHEQKKQQIAQEKRAFEVKLGQGNFTKMHKIAASVSPQERKARIKDFVDYNAKLGVTVNPINLASFDNPETTAKILSLKANLMATASVEERDEILRELTPLLPTDELSDAIDAAHKRQTTMEAKSLEFGRKRELQEQRGEQQAERQDVKIKAEKGKQREAKITNLQTGVGKINKEFEPVDRAFEQIIDIDSPDNLKNPQLRIALVRHIQALTEATKSVVRESEYKIVAQQAGLTDQFWTMVNSWRGKGKVPMAVARQIIKAARVLKKGVDRSKGKRFSPYTADARRLKMDKKEWGSIFGASVSYNTKKAAKKKPDSDRVKSLKKLLSSGKVKNPQYKKRIAEQIKKLQRAK